MRLEGRKAIVTGAAAGIGAAIAAAYVEEGARVALLDRDHEAGQAAAARLGNATSFFAVDVADQASTEVAVQQAATWLGGLTLLVNNAGFGTPGTTLTTSLDDWSRMLAVNLTGPFLMCKAALPLLLASASGCIINMASVAGMVGLKERAAYCASKGGVIALTRAIAVDHVGQGLRCNAICPGTVDTAWVDRMVAFAPDPAGTRRGMVGRQPMGRLGRPDEIARAAVYLASDDAAFVTGSTLVIDGGLTMQ